MVPRSSASPATKFPWPLETPRLRLRTLRPEDKPDLIALDGIGLDVVDSWMGTGARESFAYSGGPLPIVVESQAESAFIGVATLRYTDLSDNGEQVSRLQAGFDLNIASGNQEQDLGVEAVRAVLEFGFNGIRLHRITFACDASLAAARNWVEKAGMRLEGVFYEDTFVDGKWVDTAAYAMLESEFGQNAS